MSQVAFVVSSLIRQNMGQSGSFQVPLELFQEHWEDTQKFGSCPLLSAGPLYFLLSTLLAALVFSYFLPIALAVCSAHAGSVHGVVRRLHFASRTPNRVVFRVARVAKTFGFCMCQSDTDPRPWRR